MEWLRRVFVGSPARTFSGGSTLLPVDEMITAMMRGSGRVARLEALSVPAVLRGRNLICGSISTLPLLQLDANNRVVPLPLLEQIDPDVPNTVTLAETIEDLLFEGVSWWRVTARGFDDYPVYARHLEHSTVTLQPATAAGALLPGGYDPRGAEVYVDGVKIQNPARELIRFDSPNPPLLVAAGRAIRRAMALDRAAEIYSGNPRPLDYFSPAEDATDPDEDDVDAFLSDWAGYRRRQATGYVPKWARYNPVDTPSPQDLQLVELQQRAALDLANAMGLDPESLGVSTTSRTYQNSTDRRLSQINDTLAPYMQAITGRLSMGDITKRGYRTEFDLDGYLRADPLTRAQVSAIYLDKGVTDVDEVRAEEGLPPLSDAQRRERAKTAPAEPAAETDNVVAFRPAQRSFSGPGHTFLSFATRGFKVDAARRTVEGTVLPYTESASNGGFRFRFAPGALQFSETTRVKLLRDHDYRQALGHMLEAAETPDGLFARYRIARGEEGDRALALAEDGVLDGFSVGVDFDLAADTVPDPDDDGALLVRRADWRETSLTAMPAFDSARVTKVAASRHQGEPMHTCPTCGATLTPGVAHTCTTPATAPPPAPPAAAQPAADFQAQFTAFQAWQAEQSAQEAARLQAPPTDGPTVVDPTRRVTMTAVNEAKPYRFDARHGIPVRGTHEFSTDLFAAMRGDFAAHARIIEFARERLEFVVTTDVDELNPTRQRPDLYVDQRSYDYPMWDAINKGSLGDITPFTFPKFSSAGTLVSAHVEGTEPSLGTFVTTSQTVTPSALSGKVKISRETIDQGGNPQVSGLIWRQMLKAWYEGLEAKAALLFTANAASITDVTLTTAGGTTGQTAATETERAFTDLQFVRGGFAMDTMFSQIDYFRVLAGAKDGQGRPLYPRLGPANANGTAQARFRALDVAGVVMWPAWALAATGSVAASSFLFDREVAHGWASAPQRIDITNTEVANVYVGLFGYVATAISDFTGVREFVYDPV